MITTYVGIDVHKSFCVASFINLEGEEVNSLRFDTTKESILAFAAEKLNNECLVTFESTTNAWGILEILEPYVHGIVVSNPRKTKAIAEAKIKTDKVDARVLGELLRVNYLPTVWTPDKETRNLRQRMGRRRSLVEQRTAVKNRLHSILHQEIIKVPFDSLFNKKGREWLKTVELIEWARDAVDSDLRILATIENEIELLDSVLVKLGYSNDKIKLLMTLPGVDYNTALSVLAALGDINRFSEADKVAGYLGLVPSTKQSANKCYYGRITKQGNTNARWMLIQAAQHVRNHPGPIGNFYRKLAKKKNHNVAVVASARKLATYVYYMLKNNEPYRYAQPKSTEAKLSKLRIKATGERRVGGNKKGEGRHQNYGSGKSTRYVRSVNELYENEGIPIVASFDELAPGEQKHLRANKLVGMVRDIHKGKREEKKRGNLNKKTTKKEK